MRSVLHDLRYGLLVLRNSPGFTVVAVFTMALGIAVNTTVFSWIDSVLLHPIAGATADRELVTLETLTPDGHFINTSYPDYRDYRDSLKLVSGMTAVFSSNLRIGEGQNSEGTWGELVTGNYFDVLGIRPALGRFFSREESVDPPAIAPVIVLSYRMWQTRFQGDRRIIGKTLRVNQRPLTIIGIAPANFHGTMTGVAHDIWVPLTMIYQLNRADSTMLSNRWTRNQEIFARLKPGATIEALRAEASARAAELARAYPKSNGGIGITAHDLANAHLSGAQPLLRTPLRILMAVCGVVLLIVCANVANLLLARATARQREFAIRMALGADRGRLIRQVLTETAVLAGAGACAGMLLVLWLGPALVWLLPPVNVPVHLNGALNGSVLAFTVVVCMGAALISGMAPVLHSLRPNLNQVLSEGGRGEKSGAAGYKLRGLLVVLEVALASVALIGAGLFVKSFRAAQGIDAGFDTNAVVVARFTLADTGQPVDKQHQFCSLLRQRLEASPMITAVNYADVAPLGFDSGPWQDVQVEGYNPANGENMKVFRSLIAPGYFSLLRISQLEGRDFTEADDAKSMPVAIVNQAFAARFFAGANPVGRKIRAWGRWLTVIGIVKDVKYHSLAAPAEPYFYAPYRQFFSTGLSTVFYIRTTGNTTGAIATLRREAARLNPEAEVLEAMPLRDYISSSLYPLKVAASLLTALAVLALLLAAVGLYSVMAYAVSQRTRELGIRMALGAGAHSVLGMVLRQGLLLTTVGLAVGLAAAFAVTRLIASMLVNVTAADPMTFSAVALFLLAVAALATYVPAHRATKVDPMTALRCE